MLILQLAFFLFAVSQSSPQENTLLPFQTDAEYVRAVIDSGDVADAIIASSSALYRWQNSALFGEMIDHIILRAHKDKKTEDLVPELDHRLSIAKDGAPWEFWLETGLVAIAAGNPEDAQRCFSECLKDESINRNPYPHLLLGRSLLAQKKVSEAQKAYQAAISAASQDTSTEFHVRFLYVDDLYKAGLYPLAQCGGGPICDSLVSSCPLERAYGIYETMMYAWSIQDASEISLLTSELEEVLKKASAKPDSPFEIRRVKEALNFLRRIKDSNAGDEYVHMILDEESCLFDFWTGDYRSMYDRLSNWVTKHPISEYGEVEIDEQRFALRSVHHTYYAAACSIGLHEEAEEGFREYIKNVPYDDDTDLVGAAYAWWGYAVHQQGRDQEALRIYEEALTFIPPDGLHYGCVNAHIEESISSMQAKGE